jgi:hypothetical protein
VSARNIFTLPIEDRFCKCGHVDRVHDRPYRACGGINASVSTYNAWVDCDCKGFEEQR